jgi:hypothetical protein
MIIKFDRDVFFQSVVKFKEEENSNQVNVIMEDSFPDLLMNKN